MDFKGTTKLLIATRINEMYYLLGGYTEVLPDVGCEEAIADIKKAQDSLEEAVDKFRIRELLSEEEA